LFTRDTKKDEGSGSCKKTFDDKITEIKAVAEWLPRRRRRQMD
jgi:hypothetical protein